MIKLDLLTAISLYLIATVIGILVLWLFAERKTLLKDFSPEEKFVWHCPICAYFYVDSFNDEVSPCPRCGSYNKRGLRVCEKR